MYDAAMSDLVTEVCCSSDWRVRGGKSIMWNAEGKRVSPGGSPCCSIADLERSIAVIKAALFVSDSVELMDPTWTHDANWRLLGGLASEPGWDRSLPEGSNMFALEMLGQLFGVDRQRMNDLAIDARDLLAGPVRIWSQMPGNGYPAGVVGSDLLAYNRQRIAEIGWRPRILDPVSSAVSAHMAELGDPTVAQKWGGREYQQMLEATAELANLNLAPRPSGSIAQRALGIAPLYLLRAVPNVGSFRSERVLELRDSAGESLRAFRARLVELARDSTTVDTADTSAFLEFACERLDADYADLQKQLKDARFAHIARGRAPIGLGALSSLAYGSATGPFRPVALLSSLVAGSIAYGVTTAATTIAKKKRVREHSLFWRYELDTATAKFVNFR
jgi:hypothetical protein